MTPAGWVAAGELSGAVPTNVINGRLLAGRDLSENQFMGKNTGLKYETFTIMFSNNLKNILGKK